jgi:hypothetical protein
MLVPRPLSEEIQQIFGQLDVCPRLAAHLSLVHDAAIQIATGLAQHFPELQFDPHAVYFGAATHDLGKVLHPNELTGPGNLHESDGCGLLERLGVPSHLARFTRTHGAWDREPVAIEDLLVALADTIWKGQRISSLEDLIVNRISQVIGEARWEVFGTLDEIVTVITEKGDERLEYQRQYE